MELAFRSFPLLLRPPLAFAPSSNKRHHHHHHGVPSDQQSVWCIQHKADGSLNGRMTDSLRKLEATAQSGSIRGPPAGLDMRLTPSCHIRERQMCVVYGKREWPGELSGAAAASLEP